MATKNNGKQAEVIIQAALIHLEGKCPMTFQRLYDSTSAGVGKGGNFLPATPADFIAVFNHTTFLVEVKSSVVHKSLRDCELRSTFSENQIMSARLWERAGAVPLAIFLSSDLSFEAWRMSTVVKAYLGEKGKRKLEGSPLTSFDSDKPSVINALQTLLAGLSHESLQQVKLTHQI